MNSTTPASPDSVPAHALGVELLTRITTQSLHYRSGEEETAAASVAGLFKTVRDLLNKHPEARVFEQVAVTMLNDVVRPYTARWHGWMTGDRTKPDTLRFRDEQVRRLFRTELHGLQRRLQPYREMFARLARGDAQAWSQQLADTLKQTLGEELAAQLEADRASARPEADLGADLDAGIGNEVLIAGAVSVADINAREHATLSRRRALWTSSTTPRDDDSADTPPLRNATGLALSGGGIRSATFSLGIVQVLVRKGLLPQFDYLSTVSGGGYLGSFLSCALGTLQPGAAPSARREDVQRKIDDVFHRETGIESGLMRHLRNNSKYLLHGGFVGKMRIVGLLLSGLIWNILIVAPIPLAGALVAYLAGDWLWGDATLGDGPVLPPIFDSIAGLALCAAAAVFGAAWVALPGIELLTHGKAPKSKGAMFRAVWENATLWLGMIAAALGLVYLMPALFHGHEWLRQTLADWSPARIDFKNVAGLVPASLTAGASAVLAAIVAWLTPKWPRLRAMAVKLFILSGPVLFLFVFLLVGNRLGLARTLTGGPADVWSPQTVGWVTLGVAAWGWLCVNINTLAPHRYYRARLCECYLARRIAEDEGRKQSLVRNLCGERVHGRTEVLRQVRLTDLGADPAAPYHLLNMTLNVPTSRNKNLRGRAGDFFSASRHFCGSPLTGYVASEEVDRVDPHFDLGTAMAVSAAAASTSMGWRSLPHFRFLMTLFNVRLGYWLRRPGGRAPHRLLEGAGPWYLFREMFGRMDENCRYVNLSDGGHIENLAAYELLRRRCKFIVCVDAGHEPGMECADLFLLQRYAEIDLGIRMKCDVADLQVDAGGLSRAHGVLIKIIYPPERTPSGVARSGGVGWLLYLKLAMTGVEPAHVRDYKRENLEFPHQTTGDQIYDEAQFEAYRALGECAMAGFFRDEILQSRRPASIREWFQCLANSLLPDNDPAVADRGGASCAASSGALAR